MITRSTPSRSPDGRHQRLSMACMPATAIMYPGRRPTPPTPVTPIMLGMECNLRRRPLVWIMTSTRSTPPKRPGANTNATERVTVEGMTTLG